MQPYNDFNSQPTENKARRQRGLRRHWVLSWLTPVLGMGLLMGLCAIGTVILIPVVYVATLPSEADRASLPALIASLPTLTPTISPTQAASAASSFVPSPGQPIDAGNASSSSAYSPVEAAPAAGNAAVQLNPAAGANQSPANAPLTTALPPSPPPPVGQPGNEVVIILPPTVAPTATPTAVPAKTPTPLAPTPTAEPINSAPDDEADDTDDESDEGNTNWSFTGVRTDTSQYRNGMLVYGNLVNHSATAQNIERVSATFFDAQGNVIGEGNRIQAYWPGYTVPPGGASMPFQLLVNGLSGAADFDLSLAANSISNTPRDDFEFSNVTQSYQNSSYCVDGFLRNAGSQLQDYLIITVVLYDKEGNVINFQDEQINNPAKVVGDQTYHFKICVAPPYQNTDRYDLQAWGY